MARTLIGNIKGQDGEQGKSAYEIAVENGYTGTEAEWLESISTDGNSELLDIRVDDYGVTFDMAGDAVRAISKTLTPKVKLDDVTALGSDGTVSYQTFYDSRVMLFNFNVPTADAYVYLVGRIGTFS